MKKGAMPGHRLRELLQGLAEVPASDDRDVRGLKLDSREVNPGDLFLAMPGTRMDSRNFMADALERGAAAVVYEAEGYGAGDFVAPGVLPPATLARPRASSVPAFAVRRLRDHVGAIADRFYGAPSRKLIIIGVTGTNGKTTCTQLLAQALDQPPTRCAVIGTLGYGFPDALNTSVHTTPDAVTVHRLLADFLDQKAGYVSMEVSSHALEQGRVNDVAFDVAVFTNLTREHLDYHGDMAAYGASKAGLFDTKGLKYAVINQDDAFGRKLLEQIGDRIKTVSYGLEGGEVRARKVLPASEGLVMHIATPAGDVELRSALFGRFNAANLLAVLATLLSLDMDLKEAVSRLGRARPVPGRVERFGGSHGLPLVVVDYAHTPDALEKILLALREHVPGKLWCVFGCGGERDRGKRPEMGRIAERLADVVILTDDNPRHESPEQILNDIRTGMRTAPEIIRDRRAAIATAINEAGAKDIVLVAGKGHEDYQQIGDQRRPYSDRQTVRNLLEAQGVGG